MIWRRFSTLNETGEQTVRTGFPYEASSKTGHTSCFVYERFITCPYFAIGFRREDKDVAAARCKAAAIAGPVLYNRFVPNVMPNEATHLRG